MKRTLDRLAGHNEVHNEAKLVREELRCLVIAERRTLIKVPRTHATPHAPTLTSECIAPNQRKKPGGWWLLVAVVALEGEDG
jgi:hypothetical protein